MKTHPLNGGVARSGFPSIVDEEERLSYKQEFDQDHHEYKSLQAELDGINQELAKLHTHMNTHPEGSPQFLVSRPSSISKMLNSQLHTSHSQF